VSLYFRKASKRTQDPEAKHLLAGGRRQMLHQPMELLLTLLQSCL